MDTLQLARIYVIVCRAMASLKQQHKHYKRMLPNVVERVKERYKASIRRQAKQIAELDQLLCMIEMGLKTPGFVIEALNLYEVWPDFLSADGHRLQDWKWHEGLRAHPDPKKALEEATKSRP